MDSLKKKSRANESTHFEIKRTNNHNPNLRLSIPRFPVQSAARRKKTAVKSPIATPVPISHRLLASDTPPASSAGPALLLPFYREARTPPRLHSEILGDAPRGLSSYLRPRRIDRPTPSRRFFSCRSARAGLTVRPI